MKKLLAILLSLVLVFSLAACNSAPSEGSSAETTSGKTENNDQSPDTNDQTPPNNDQSADTNEQDPPKTETVPENITISAFFDSFVDTPELFYLGNKPAKDTAPAYVLCVKNKQVMAIPNISERTYGDFDGLSDEKIITMLQEDIGDTFEFYDEWPYAIELPLGDYLKYRDYAYNITTDDTGNSVKNETVVIPTPYSVVGYEINYDGTGTYNDTNWQKVIYVCHNPLSKGSEDIREHTIYYANYRNGSKLHESYSSSTLSGWGISQVEFNNSSYPLGANCPSRTVYNTQWYQIAENLYSRSNYADIAGNICVDFSDTEIDRSIDRINIDAIQMFEITSELKGVEMWPGITKEEAIALLEDASVFDVEYRLVDGDFYYFVNGKPFKE